MNHVESSFTRDFLRAFTDLILTSLLCASVCTGHLVLLEQILREVELTTPQMEDR